jgi:hypothetical protein
LSSQTGISSVYRYKQTHRDDISMT